MITINCYFFKFVSVVYPECTLFALYLLQILKLLPRRIVNSDGGDLLDCILNGLPDNAGACKNKVKVLMFHNFP